jgi:hypothetical protein
LTRENSFLTEQYNFGDIGRSLLFALGVYIFDLMIQVTYAIDEYFNKIFIAQILGGLSVCVLLISLSKGTELYNIFLLLIVGIAMFYMKMLTLLISGETKRIDYQRNLNNE